MTDEEVVYESRRARREALRASDVNQDGTGFSTFSAPASSAPATQELPSRRELRRIAQETGVIPVITPEMLRETDWKPDTSPLAALAASYEQIVLAREAQSAAPPVEPVVAQQAPTGQFAATPTLDDVNVIATPTPVVPPSLEGDWRDQLADESEHGWVENHSAEIGIVQSPALQTLVVDSYHTGDISGPLNATGEIFITGQILIEPIVEQSPGLTIDAGVDLTHAGIPRRASEALSIIGKPAASEKHKRIPSVGSAVVAGLAAGLGALAIAIAALAYFTDIL
jgi:hypothetical protein